MDDPIVDWDTYSILFLEWCEQHTEEPIEKYGTIERVMEEFNKTIRFPCVCEKKLVNP